MPIHSAAKLEQLLDGVRVRLNLLGGADHGDPKFESPDNVEVLDFLDKTMK